MARGGIFPCITRPTRKVFLLLFLQKKKDLLSLTRHVRVPLRNPPVEPMMNAMQWGHNMAAHAE